MVSVFRFRFAQSTDLLSSLFLQYNPKILYFFKSFYLIQHFNFSGIEFFKLSIDIFFQLKVESLFSIAHPLQISSANCAMIGNNIK